MQKVALRKGKTTAPYVKQDHDKIMHFSLDGALPEGQTLALNLAYGTLSLISSEGGPSLLVQQQFTATEISVVLPLLDSFPDYCPYEVMFASFYNGNVSERAVARCRQRLQEAMEAGIWDQEMRPVRNALSRTRLKMRDFGLDISSILETGYILMIMSTTHKVHEIKIPAYR